MRIRCKKKKVRTWSNYFGEERRRKKLKKMGKRKSFLYYKDLRERQKGYRIKTIWKTFQVRWYLPEYTRGVCNNNNNIERVGDCISLFYYAHSPESSSQKRAFSTTRASCVVSLSYIIFIYTYIYIYIYMLYVYVTFSGIK